MPDFTTRPRQSARRSICLLPIGGRRHSEWEVFRRSMAATRAPVDASHAASQQPTHHSGLMRNCHSFSVSDLQPPSPDAPNRSLPANNQAAPMLATTPSAGDGTGHVPVASRTGARLVRFTSQRPFYPALRQFSTGCFWCCETDLERP
jgi:hypothetical protein